MKVNETNAQVSVCVFVCACLCVRARARVCACVCVIRHLHFAPSALCFECLLCLVCFIDIIDRFSSWRMLKTGAQWRPMPISPIWSPPTRMHPISKNPGLFCFFILLYMEEGGLGFLKGTRKQISHALYTDAYGHHQPIRKHEK